jgi:hypothetical protein
MDGLFADSTKPTTAERVTLRDSKAPDGKYIYDGGCIEERLLGSDYVKQAAGKRMGHPWVLQIFAARARDVLANKPSNPSVLAELGELDGIGDESWSFGLRARDMDMDSGVTSEVNNLEGMKKYGAVAVTKQVEQPGGGTRATFDARGTFAAMRAKGVPVEVMRAVHYALRTHRVLNKSGKAHNDIHHSMQQSYSWMKAPSDGC